MPRFSLPISCAALARWLKRSTSLRSSSSIWRRQSAISIKAVVSLRALAKTVSPIFAAKTSAFQACNTKQMDSRADDRRPTTRLIHSATASASLPGLPSMVCTMALPTTAASANFPTEANCSGPEIPNPTAIGSLVDLRSLLTSRCASSANSLRAPVTPVRDTA